MIPTNNSRGSVLILTMGVVVFLTGLALVFSRQMRVEALASENLLLQVQADAAVRGAAQHILNRLASNLDQTTLDSEIQSEAVHIGDGQFWCVRPDQADEHNYAFGIMDESSKLNINTATADMLLRLPGMTPELAASIVDWRDPDDIVGDGGGAESQYYLQLPEPYNCKNAPFETLGELLLVKGATRELLYGKDANRNGVIDASERGGEGPLSGLNGQMECGLCKYLTVYSMEVNRTQNGDARTLIADTTARSMTALSNLLSKTLSAARVAEVIARMSGGPPPLNVLDFYFKSGLKLDEFKSISDSITTSREGVRVGLINVNTAPREVLRCLPGLEEGDIDQIIAKRQSNGPDLNNIAWVADILNAQKAIQVGEYLTTRSSQFSADITGVCGNGRSFKRARYVFDIRNTPPRILNRKDLTYLGWPLSTAISDALQSGLPVAGTSTQSFSLGKK